MSSYGSSCLNRSPRMWRWRSTVWRRAPTRVLSVSRLPLPDPVRRTLNDNTAAIAAATAAEQVREAGRRWGNFLPTAGAQAVRSTLRRMASGLNRCMYCEDSEGTDIDHFRPKSAFPLQTFEWENHLLACSYCNSNMKRTQFPLEADSPLLIDPTAEDPQTHLAFSPTTGVLTGKTRKGVTSIDVFGLNRETCRRGRANAFIAFLSLIRDYAVAVRDDELDLAGRILDVVREYPDFQMVRSFVRELTTSAGGDVLLPDDIRGILGQHPELLVAV